MKSPLPLLLLSGTALLAACGKPAAESTTAPAQAPVAAVRVPPATEQLRDLHSFAEPAIARVTHVDLDLAADFRQRRLGGTATLSIEADGNAPVLTLDTRGLTIESVTDGKGKALPFSMGEEVEFLGAPLKITLGDARKVTVHYYTRPEAQALQWLEPSQTAGKRRPYLYSQGEAALTRTWVPTQDSPGIKQTWSARITAPADLTAVMSAEMLGPEPGRAPGTRTWSFRMEEPVAPYMIAIAIGDLAFQKLGERTGVWTEPSMLKAAAWEFADTEKMVEAAEALYGPYRWGRYDLLVMPPSFPFGGMENPRLTFATPTVIAGDRSLVALIAHELAHSWSGNLVTNATWADFWLNEGFTTYFQDRIMEAVYGEEFTTMQMDLSWDELQSTIEEVGGSNSPETMLHIDLKGRDPDDGMTNIPYEKGAVFLRTIETAVGRERWDEYLRGYFDRFAFQSQTAAGFLADLREHLIRDDAALESQLQLDTWVYAAGLPDNAVHRRSVVLERIDKDAVAFAAGRALEGDAVKWSTSERVRFLNRLPREMPVEKLEALRKLLDLDNQNNSEVTFAWLRLAIANRYDAAVPQLERFLSTQGRRKFVLPLFTDLMGQGDWGKEHATRIYAKARPGYHSVTSGRVDSVVQAGP
jgi:leukotriene-A4 hydrolase